MADSGRGMRSRGLGHKRSEEALSPRPGSAKLGRTSGLMAVGAWAARVEIADMLESGVLAKGLIGMIRKGEEGDFPLAPYDHKVPFWFIHPGSSAAPAPGRNCGISSEAPQRAELSGARREIPQGRRSPSISPTTPTGNSSSGRPSWGEMDEAPQVTFRKQARPPLMQLAEPKV